MCAVECVEKMCLAEKSQCYLCDLNHEMCGVDLEEFTLLERNIRIQ